MTPFQLPHKISVIHDTPKEVGADDPQTLNSKTGFERGITLPEIMFVTFPDVDSKSATMRGNGIECEVNDDLEKHQQRAPIIMGTLTCSLALTV